MKVVELLKQRRNNWQQLEMMCGRLENHRKSKIPAADLTRFASLYRATCADLALADAYQLPPNTVLYLHRLVGRAHNQLYRSRRFQTATWARMLLKEVPQRVVNDRCVQTAFALFWVVFLISASLAIDATTWPNFAEEMISRPMLDQMESSFSQPMSSRSGIGSPVMASFYIEHNTGIGLQCFAGGLLLIPGLIITIFNAAHLGAAFGYMARPEVSVGTNFYDFVTAHGPFELTAIVLSSGAGLRLGLAWIQTKGMRRTDSLRYHARESMPLMGAAMVMFFLAALLEGFLSPTAAPYWIKALVAAASSGALTVYFVILGFPKEKQAPFTATRSRVAPGDLLTSPGLSMNPSEDSRPNDSRPSLAADASRTPTPATSLPREPREPRKPLRAPHPSETPPAKKG